MLRLERRAPGNEDEAPLVPCASPTAGLREIGADRVSRPYELNPKRPLIERGPPEHVAANHVRGGNGPAVDHEIVEVPHLWMNPRGLRASPAALATGDWGLGTEA